MVLTSVHVEVFNFDGKLVSVGAVPVVGCVCYWAQRCGKLQVWKSTPS